MVTEDMPETHYLVQRRQGWYVRVGVPPSLRPVVGRSDIVKTLRTRSLEEARRRRWRAVAEIKASIEATKAALEEATGYSLDQGAITVPVRNSDDGGATAKHRRTTQGNTVADHDGNSLTVALSRWLSQSTTKTKTQDEQRRAVEKLIDRVGDVPVDRITRKVAADHVDKLQASGRAPATINKQISALSSLWSWLIRKAIVEDNVWTNQSVKVEQADKRPYTWAEVRRVLEHPRVEGTMRDIVELALFTGARGREVAHLKVEDIEARGVHITDSKTRGATRWIPLEGRAWEIVSRLAKGRTRGYLFDELQPDKYGNRFFYTGKKFARIRDELFGEGSGKFVDFHSFRRTYATVGDNLVDAILLARLMGHEAPTLATKVYSGGAWRERLREAQRAIVEETEGSLSRITNNRPA